MNRSISNKIWENFLWTQFEQERKKKCAKQIIVYKTPNRLVWVDGFGKKCIDLTNAQRNMQCIRCMHRHLISKWSRDKRILWFDQINSFKTQFFRLSSRLERMQARQISTILIKCGHYAFFFVFILCVVCINFLLVFRRSFSLEQKKKHTNNTYTHTLSSLW